MASGSRTSSALRTTWFQCYQTFVFFVTDDEA